MTDDQENALEALMSVRCKIDPEGCEDGHWCAARALVAEAFDLEILVEENTENLDVCQGCSCLFSGSESGLCEGCEDADVVDGAATD